MPIFSPVARSVKATQKDIDLTPLVPSGRLLIYVGPFALLFLIFFHSITSFALASFVFCGSDIVRTGLRTWSSTGFFLFYFFLRFARLPLYFVRSMANRTASLAEPAEGLGGHAVVLATA